MKEQIEKMFTYNPPKGDQPKRYVELREKFKEVALLIDELCPNSREKSTAITQLQLANMLANASIAVNE